MPEDRLTEYLDGIDAAIDAAADWRPVLFDVPVALVVRDRRLDMTAHAKWKLAWRRGDVSDVEMAWYESAVRKHPASWVGFLNQYL